MIRIVDALTLAQTKLKARKVRTALTIVVSGLLFSLATVLILTSDGIFASYDRMAAESMTGRYIISGMEGYQDTSTVLNDPELPRLAEERYKKLVDEKKAEAKRLGIEYDATGDPAPVEIIDGVKRLSFASPVAQQVLAEKTAEKFPAPTMEAFKKLADQYAPTDYYEVKNLQASGGGVYHEMKDGKEKYGDDNSKANEQGAPNDISEPKLAPKAMLETFMFKDYKWQASSGRVPVVVSQKRASTLANFKAPDKDAPAKERLDYSNSLREKVNGLTFDVCYRNAVSVEQISQAVAVAKEIEKNKNDRNYQQPALVYETPDPTSCGQAVVKRDVRSAEEKQYTAKLREFNQKFGLMTDPLQHKITYEVVGVAPNGWADSSVGFSMGIKDMITMLFMNDTFRFAIPSELYGSIENRAGLDTALAVADRGEAGQFDMRPMSQFYVEFADAEVARQFAEQETCRYGMNGCEPKEKPFMLQPFGSNSVAINQAKQAMATALMWIVGVVTVIASIIAGLTIGRTIADGRRETAVFRAIGFKRMDINQIYATYTVLLSLLTVVFTFLLSVAIAAAINSWLWLDTTLQAQLALGVTDASARFSYIAFTPKLLAVFGMIIVAGVIGMLLPLIRNVRRNPIRDMRDE